MPPSSAVDSTDFTLILVTRRNIVPATHFTPAYYVCMFRNTFEGEVLPLSKGREILFWGAIPEHRILLKGIIGDIVCHERHWVEVVVEPIGTPSAEPWYHIRFPIGVIHFKPHTIMFHFIFYHLLDSQHTKFPQVKRLPSLFRQSMTQVFAKPC